MIETQRVLPETPRAAAPDLLSDLLDSMHLAGVVLFRAEFREPWSVLTPGSAQLARILPFRTEHIIPFHIVAAGCCCLELRGHAPVWLETGDAILLPYGDGHSLHGRELAKKVVPVGQLLPGPPWSEILVVSHGGAGELTHIICGFLQCDEILFHPLLRHLPVLLHVSPGRAPSDEWLASTIRHTALEASRIDPGGRAILPRLTELMFVEILRKHMQEVSAEEVGWLAAASDPVAGAALALLHRKPFETWNVDRLARQVGVSRTVLAARFKHFLDMPPMHYLTHWRLLLAAQHMQATDAPMKGIADRAGYKSEAAFSRAFKRHFRVPPGEWRQRSLRG